MKEVRGLLTLSHLHTSTLFRRILGDIFAECPHACPVSLPFFTGISSLESPSLSLFFSPSHPSPSNLSFLPISTSCVPLLVWYFRVFFVHIPSNFSLSHHCYYFCSPLASWFPSSPINAFKAVLHISGATKSEHISSLPCLANGARTVCTSLTSLDPYLWGWRKTPDHAALIEAGHVTMRTLINHVCLSASTLLINFIRIEQL